MNATKHAVGFCFATILGLCALAPVRAAPVLSNTAALKSATENPITDVRWVRRGRARAAVAAGVGLAAAASYRYGAGYPYYGYGYSSSYNYGYPSSSSYYGSVPNSYGYNYGYAPYSGSYSYNYGYTSGYYGYGVRRVARGVARRVAYRR